MAEDIERYPGQKARVTEAVDAVKAGMLAINAEIKALVDAAVAGDFGKRGNARRFEFVYAELVEGLNNLMATADHGLSEVGEVLSALADGDLIEVDSGENVGMVIRLEHAPTEGRPGADQVTALRVRGVETSRPEEWSLWP